MSGPTDATDTVPPLAIELVRLDNLQPDPANPRQIAAAELEALTRSIQHFGLVDPILARQADRTVIAGHQRLLAARKLGLPEVPTIFLDVSAAQARLLNVALNQIGGDFDQELLARLLADLQDVPDVDLSLTGFADDEIQQLLTSLDVREKRDRIETFDLEAAVATANARTCGTAGDVWQLGDHRVMCADATDPAQVARLLANVQPALLATDPPYFVDLTTRGGGRGRPRGTGVADWDHATDPDAIVAFYTHYLTAALAHLAPRAPVYQWYASRHHALVEAAWAEAGLLVHQQLVWVKPAGVPGRSHFMWRHEPCLFGWRQGQAPKRKPPRDITTVWEIDGRAERLGVHVTQKPIALFQRPMEYHTDQGALVYEPFLGSGTQLIAAERTGRACYAMERDPTYAEVAISRWEAFTGDVAEQTNEQRS